MSKPAVVFPDPILETLRILRAAGTVAQFGTKAPDEFPADAVPALPWAAVSIDSSSATYPVVETTNLRIRVWASTDDGGYSLAQELRAALLSYEGDARVRSYGARTSPRASTDPDDGKPLSAFTVAARTKPL